MFEIVHKLIDVFTDGDDHQDPRKKEYGQLERRRRLAAVKESEYRRSKGIPIETRNEDKLQNRIDRNIVRREGFDYHKAPPRKSTSGRTSKHVSSKNNNARSFTQMGYGNNKYIENNISGRRRRRRRSKRNFQGKLKLIWKSICNVFSNMNYHNNEVDPLGNLRSIDMNDPLVRARIARSKVFKKKIREYRSKKDSKIDRFSLKDKNNSSSRNNERFIHFEDDDSDTIDQSDQIQEGDKSFIKTSDIQYSGLSNSDSKIDLRSNSNIIHNTKKNKPAIRDQNGHNDDIISEMQKKIDLLYEKLDEKSKELEHTKRQLDFVNEKNSLRDDLLDDGKIDNQYLLSRRNMKNFTRQNLKPEEPIPSPSPIRSVNPMFTSSPMGKYKKQREIENNENINNLLHANSLPPIISPEQRAVYSENNEKNRNNLTHIDNISESKKNNQLFYDKYPKIPETKHLNQDKNEVDVSFSPIRMDFSKYSS